MTITVMQILMLVIGGINTLLFWFVKKYINKVDDIENRVIQLETVINLLGDIKDDLHKVRTDVEVIKSKIDLK